MRILDFRVGGLGKLWFSDVDFRVWFEGFETSSLGFRVNGFQHSISKVLEGSSEPDFSKNVSKIVKFLSKLMIFIEISFQESKLLIFLRLPKFQKFRFRAAGSGAIGSGAAAAPAARLEQATTAHSGGGAAARDDFESRFAKHIALQHAMGLFHDKINPGWSLLHVLAGADEEPRNVWMSPASIECALSMLAMGASKQTESELLHVREP